MPMGGKGCCGLKKIWKADAIYTSGHIGQAGKHSGTVRKSASVKENEAHDSLPKRRPYAVSGAKNENSRQLIDDIC